MPILDEPKRATTRQQRAVIAWTVGALVVITIVAVTWPWMWAIYAFVGLALAFIAPVVAIILTIQSTIEWVFTGQWKWPWKF